MDLEKVNISFFAVDGHKIAGTLYKSSNPSKEKRPAILLCQGLSGIKSMVLPYIAQAFAEKGFIALAFDYRGYGESTGRKGFIDLLGRGDDALQALSFLSSQEEVDSERIGIYGLSLGGGIAAYAAINDPKIKAVVLVSGFASGKRLLRSLRTSFEWIEFKDKLLEDQQMLARIGKSRVVDIQEIIPFSGSYWLKYLNVNKDAKNIPKEAQDSDEPLFHLSTADLILHFDISEAIKKIAPRPILFIHGERDDVVPVEDILEVYREAEDPKRLIILENKDHIDLNTGEGLIAQTSHALDWFKKYL